jgi:hypothetical protein
MRRSLKIVAIVVAVPTLFSGLTFKGGQENLGKSVPQKAESFDFTQLKGVESRYGGGADMDTFLVFNSGAPVPQGFAAYDDGQVIRVNTGAVGNRLLRNLL